MTTVALMGAGGKMGCRITDNLKDSPYRMSYVEISAAGRARLSERNVAVTAAEEAIPIADIVILAVPDRIIRAVSAQVVPQMKPGSMLVLLDPAAAYLGEVCLRGDMSYFVTHPCHPPLFNDEETPEGRADHFGGIAARQNIVCALMQGPDADYAKGEMLARAMFAPVMNSHRITVEQMALLEPAMAETVGATCAVIMGEALDEAVRRGVPYEAARDFLLGHVQIELAIVFGFVDSPFSDAAQLAIEWAKKRLFQPNWKDLFNAEVLRENVATMLHPEVEP